MPQEQHVTGPSLQEYWKQNLLRDADIILQIGGEEYFVSSGHDIARAIRDSGDAYPTGAERKYAIQDARHILAQHQIAWLETAGVEKVNSIGTESGSSQLAAENARLSLLEDKKALVARQQLVL